MNAVIWLGAAAIFAVITVLLARLGDRVRHVDDDDKYAGAYRGKSGRRPGPFSASEYEPMDTHGNRNEGGGLQ